MASILVVDDEPEVVEAIRRVLEHAGFAVAVASSVESGLQITQERQPDVVVTDVIMPKRSEEHTSELQSLAYLVCRLLLEKKKKQCEAISTDVLTFYPDGDSTHPRLPDLLPRVADL